MISKAIEKNNCTVVLVTILKVTLGVFVVNGESSSVLIDKSNLCRILCIVRNVARPANFEKVVCVQLFLNEL